MITPRSGRPLRKALLQSIAATLACVGSAVGASGEAVASGEPGGDANRMVWLVFVDDLHLDFRETGRLRHLLRTVEHDLIQDGDLVAVRSSGPGVLDVPVTSAALAFGRATRRVAGAALKPESQHWSPEIAHRAKLAITTVQALLEDAASRPRGRTAMLYVSHGYSADDPELVAGLWATRERAIRAGVPIFTLDSRLLDGGPRLPAELPAEVWQAHWALTRGSLEFLASATGGLSHQPGETLPQLVDRIKAAFGR
jgi:hypothetical protein